ncbi:MAG TPA: hypothetical protein PLN99_07890, partial [Daejeonella sp.]|nr:hypothetical protein [Daejeonella sp.]
AVCAKAEPGRLFKNRIRSAFLKKGNSMFFIYLFLFFKGDDFSYYNNNQLIKLGKMAFGVFNRKLHSLSNNQF